MCMGYGTCIDHDINIQPHMVSLLAIPVPTNSEPLTIIACAITTWQEENMAAISCLIQCCILLAAA